VRTLYIYSIKRKKHDYNREKTARTMND
jgi:hypothetical protein